MVLPSIEKCKEAKQIQEEEFFVRMKSKGKKKLGHYRKLIGFCLGSIVLIIFSLIGWYFILLYQLAFTSLILWRGLRNYAELTPIIESLSNVLRDMASFLQLPDLAYYIAFPFLSFFNLLSKVHINLSSVNITCSGSIAPIQLLLNCFILGLLIITIKSDYQLLLNILIQDINKGFIRNQIQKFVLKREGNLCGNYFLIALLITGFLTLNPFFIALRYSMGFVNINSFGANNHAAHEITSSCDNSPSTPFFDSILGYGSSVFAWWLIIPTMYCLSEVVVHRTIYSEEEKIEMQRLKGVIPDSLSIQDESLEMPRLDRRPFQNPVSPADQESVKLEVDDDNPSEQIREGEQNEPRKLSQIMHDLFYFLRENMISFFSIDSWLSSIFWQWILALHKHIVNSSFGKKKLDQMGYQFQRVPKMVSTTRFLPLSAQAKSMKISKQASYGLSPIKQYSMLRQTLENSEKAPSQPIFQGSIRFGDIFKKLRERTMKRRERKKKIQEMWEKSLIENDDEFDDLPSHLPSYFELCVDVKEELRSRWGCPGLLGLALGLLGIGHVLTHTGRFHWQLVLKNYRAFVYACVGLWDDEVVSAFDLEVLSLALVLTNEEDDDKEDATKRPFSVPEESSHPSPPPKSVLELMEKYTSHGNEEEVEEAAVEEQPRIGKEYVKSNSLAQLLSEDKTQIADRKHLTIKERELVCAIQSILPALIKEMICSRVILFQVIPIGVVLTTLFMAISPTPIILKNSFLLQFLPSRIVKGRENHEIAIAKEMMYLFLTTKEEEILLIERYYWRIFLRGWIIYIQDSRGLQWIFQCIKFLLAFFLVFYHRKLLLGIIICLFLLLPFYLSKSLEFVLFLGRYLDIHDGNFLYWQWLFEMDKLQELEWRKLAKQKENWMHKCQVQDQEIQALKRKIDLMQQELGIPPDSGSFDHYPSPVQQSFSHSQDDGQGRLPMEKKKNIDICQANDYHVKDGFGDEDEAMFSFEEVYPPHPEIVGNETIVTDEEGRWDETFVSEENPLKATTQKLRYSRDK
jgi:hypothetical protein